MRLKATEGAAFSGKAASGRESGKAPGHAFDFLPDIGIDPDTGLKYCQDDVALYRSVLMEFCQGAGKRMADIQRYHAAADWKSYGIQVHALKSSARMIGAAELAEAAARLESASDREDLQTIRQLHPEMLERYRALTDALAAHMDFDADDSDDAEILEFLPE